MADPIGRHLLIGNAPFEVIGVMSSRGSDGWGQNYDDMVFIPYRAGRARVYRTQTQPDYSIIDVVSADVVDEAESAVGTLLSERHGREDVAIGNAAARIKAEMQTREAMTMMLSLIAAVSLVVGGIGLGFEASLGNVFPQGWQFYAITLTLYLVLAYPGFVYRYLFKRTAR